MMIRCLSLFFAAGLLAGLGSEAYAQGSEPATPPAAPASGPPAPPTVDQSGVVTTPIPFFEKRGEGPIPVVLIPGVASDWSVWDTFMARNAQRYTMYALRLPGFGGSKPPELGPNDNHENLSATRNAHRALIKFIADNNIERPVLMGHGYGGMLALRLALARPELARAVVCVDSMPVIPMADPSRDADFDARINNIRSNLLRSFVKQTDEEWRNQQFMNAMALVTDDRRARELGEMFNTTDRAVAFHYYLESLLIDLRPELAKNQTPIFFIAPLAPTGVPEKISKQQWNRAVGAPPNITLKWYPDCRHFVMDDNPGQLDADVDLFLRGESVPDSLRSFEQLPPAQPVTQPRDRPPPTGRESE